MRRMTVLGANQLWTFETLKLMELELETLLWKMEKLELVVDEATGWPSPLVDYFQVTFVH